MIQMNSIPELFLVVWQLINLRNQKTNGEFYYVDEKRKI